MYLLEAAPAREPARSRARGARTGIGGCRGLVAYILMMGSTGGMWRGHGECEACPIRRIPQTGQTIQRAI
jgi:hypothetical protein